MNFKFQIKIFFEFFYNLNFRNSNVSTSALHRISLESWVVYSHTENILSMLELRSLSLLTFLYTVQRMSISMPYLLPSTRFSSSYTCINSCSQDSCSILFSALSISSNFITSKCSIYELEYTKL